MFDDFILINAKYDLKLALFSIFHFKQNNLIKSNNQIKLSLVFILLLVRELVHVLLVYSSMYIYSQHAWRDAYRS